MLTRASDPATLLLIALALLAVGMSGCAASTPLLDAMQTDGYVYRLEEAGWVRYDAERPIGLVDPTVLVVRRADEAPLALRDLRALGLTGFDHLRQMGSTPEAEVHFVDAESGFAAYEFLLAAQARGEWAGVALREVEDGGADAFLSPIADSARGAGQQ